MFILYLLDIDYGNQYSIKRYINDTENVLFEQFILLISQEIVQDSVLKSIEFGYNSAGTISIIVILFYLYTNIVNMLIFILKKVCKN